MPRHLLLHLALLLATITTTAAAPPSSATSVYMLRLDDEIGAPTWRYTQQAVGEASRRGADMLLVHINTYGGSVVHADSIRTALMRAPMPVVGYVDNNAASAGALIALACDTLYMRPGSTMGAATVVNGTDGQAMPDKYQSYMRAMMRATAEHHGLRPDGSWRRDPAVAEAMVDPRVSIDSLIDSTRVLTFTTAEALARGYADGTADDIDQLMRSLSRPRYTLAEYTPSWQDRLIGFLGSPGVQAVLIMIILGGIYMEMHTPGMGFPSAAAIIAAALYFMPLYITGIASSWLVLLFVAGLVLIVLEIFVVPGFGVTGITGIACMAAALLMALVEGRSFSLGMAGVADLWESLGVFTAGVAMTVGAVWYLTSRHGPKWVRRHTDLTTELRTDRGFIAVDMAPASMVGRKGAAVTDMRPAGKVEIDGEPYDAVASMGFIHAGAQVQVIKYENAQLYVKVI